MRILVATLLFACLIGLGRAQSLGPLVTDEPVVWRGDTIKLGDAKAHVRKVAGRQPDRSVTLYQGESYPVGEQWMFFGSADDRRLLWVEFIHGHVTRVWTEPLGERR